MAKLPPLRDRVAQLIGIPSISSTQAGLDQSNEGVVAILFDWFQDLGFTCETVPVSDGKVNLIATLGHGANGLVLSGHTDTVPCNETLWNSNPFTLTESEDQWAGLGVIDMKGFFPLVIEAIQNLPMQHLKRPLVVVATSDEESSMAGAK